ncbi:metalloregulator ArsR/SmtB family transcription factor [Chryseobacterium sp. SSA4.19]|uniref:ArsR/SmtB family transcription factor n=1 Tax=unclassified Chryseobacterium TaxID=2593645 RepID=UPI001F4D6C7E|nr:MULTISPECIES: metalloregulator ArsR/SmtB family transcription factor [unclassified Chryseobacterium]MCJ8154141.1 metalloregulator ArsR/SmtB family transcription factor [Chryseobacterium sp. SSA4.19]
MGLTKTEIFTDEQNNLASLFKVLAHPARIAILQYIINQKACICNDLVDELGLAQATISQHLKELKSIGIIQGTIEGKSVCYCIEDKKWKKIQVLFNQFFEQDVKVGQCC